MGSLELILGPMFSGKTTKLIELYNNSNENHNCLAINYELDKRYGENKIISHDKKEINSLCITQLSQLFTEQHIEKLLKAEYLFINEAQFFTDLKLWVEFCLKILNKNLILCGLDLDYKREQFGELLDLTPLSKKIHKMQGKCSTQNCNNLTEFTHRITNDKQLILIGNDEYIPLCRKCYEEKNLYQ